MIQSVLSLDLHPGIDKGGDTSVRNNCGSHHGDHLDVQDVYTRPGWKFQLRFRVPFTVFAQILVPECRLYNKESRIAIEFKILISLRFLARGHDTDTMEELSGVSQATCHRIFQLFIRNYSKRLFNKYVFVPTGRGLVEVMRDYKLLGFNGAWGSIDVTHVFWNKCPEEFKHFCTGKEGKTTLAFLAVVVMRKDS